MIDDYKILVAAVLSLVVHFAVERGLRHLPPRLDLPPPHKLNVAVVPPPEQPPPEPEKPPEPKPPEPTNVPHEAPRPHPVHAPAVAPVPKDTPPPDHPAVTTDTSDEPVFGVTMESTSTGGTGPAMPVGNTTRPAPTGSNTPVKPLVDPVPAFEATKMPVMDERCRFGLGKYTDEALQAGVEGQVVIDLIVGEDGHVRDVSVVQSLPHGLTEEAVKALKQCKFSPGEKDGHAVPVKIRGFKVTFVLPSGGN